MIFKDGNPVRFVYKDGQAVEKIFHNGNLVFEQGFEREVSGVPPLTLNAVRNTAENYRIFGNTVLNGTPTPENPVDVLGVSDLVTQGEYNGMYKISVISANQTTNIYLSELLYKIDDYADYVDFENGSVVRKIGKFVLDGSEAMNIENMSNAKRFSVNPLGDAGNNDADEISTHFRYIGHSQTGGYPGEMSSSPLAFRCWLWSDISSLPDFRNWLSAQYQNGTPVTVWYVLANPETQPVTLPEIPLAKGSDTLSIGTTIQPSNLYIKYKGR